MHVHDSFVECDSTAARSASGAATKPCRGTSSLLAAAPPSLGAGAGHSFRPRDERLGALATPSRSNLPWFTELPTPSEAKTPSFGGTGGLFGCHTDCDCVIVYSAVSSTPMTDGRHALRRARPSRAAAPARRQTCSAVIVRKVLRLNVDLRF